MSRRQVIILVATALIVVAGVILGILSVQNGDIVSPDREGREGVREVTETGPNGEETPVFSSVVPDDAELTEPEEQSVAAPGAEEKFGAFAMTVSSSGFSPNSITVEKGDVVQIRLTAQGGNYDFSMPYNGLYIMVPEGETKQITFGINTTGTYEFMCRDFCPNKTITGQLIVLP